MRAPTSRDDPRWIPYIGWSQVSPPPSHIGADKCVFIMTRGWICKEAEPASRWHWNWQTGDDDWEIVAYCFCEQEWDE